MDPERRLQADRLHQVQGRQAAQEVSAHPDQGRPLRAVDGGDRLRPAPSQKPAETIELRWFFYIFLGRNAFSAQTVLFQQGLQMRTVHPWRRASSTARPFTSRNPCSRNVFRCVAGRFLDLAQRQRRFSSSGASADGRTLGRLLRRASGRWGRSAVSPARQGHAENQIGNSRILPGNP